MHTIKHLLGGKKGEEGSTHAATGEQIEPEPRRTSITRQILNPDGDKYDEQRFGAPATVAAINPPGENNPGPDALARDAILRTDTTEEKLEHKPMHGILRQIINPHGAKYDQEGYGTTAHVVEQPTGGSAASGAVPHN